MLNTYHSISFTLFWQIGGICRKLVYLIVCLRIESSSAICNAFNSSQQMPQLSAKVRNSLQNQQQSAKVRNSLQNQQQSAKVYIITQQSPSKATGRCLSINIQKVKNVGGLNQKLMAKVINKHLKLLLSTM